MKLCLFTNIFWKHPLEDAVEAAARFGYRAVELLVGWGANHLEHDMPESRIQEIKRTVDGHGLAVACIHTNLGGNAQLGMADKGNETELETLRVFCEKAGALNCDLLKVTCGRLVGDVVTADDLQRCAEWLRRASDLAVEYGIRLAGEIHFGHMSETATQAADVVDRVQRDNFGVIHDAGNLFVAGADYGESTVNTLGKRIFHVHIKDMKPCSDEREATFHYKGKHFRGAFLGEGDVDHRPVLRRLMDIGFTGCLSCECMKKDDPWETARREAESLRSMLAALNP